MNKNIFNFDGIESIFKFKSKIRYNLIKIYDFSIFDLFDYVF